ncbi:hypothetical protein ABEX25_28630 [Paenibacillus thiaminolyticus]|uniref:hypothetical protein n=1 Tax=Paenibacillus thiaminolyticus TaxID=49283 RepID=UPI003D2A1A9F
MSKLENVKKQLENLEGLDSIEVEYKDGEVVEFEADGGSLDSFLEDINWDKVTDIEVELDGGDKVNLDWDDEDEEEDEDEEVKDSGEEDKEEDDEDSDEEDKDADDEDEEEDKDVDYEDEDDDDDDDED